VVGGVVVRRASSILQGVGACSFALGILVSSCGEGDEPPATQPAPDAGHAPDAGGGGCTTNTECASGVCDLVLKRCVECAADAGCAPGWTCAFNRCVEPATCKTSADCTNQVCDLGNGRCAQCLVSADCPPGYGCNSELRCVAAPACENSLTCEGSLVCDPVMKRCVECVGNGDCDQNQHCDKNVCRRICDSDNDCRPLGLLCDRSAGNCVTCLDHADCEGGRFCDAGLCRTDICAPGNFTCRDGGLAECNASGGGYGAPSPCPSRQSCSLTSGAARCEDQTCVPSSTYCDADGGRVMVCAVDGLSATVREDCVVTGKACVAATCRTQLCKPRETFCANNVLQVCGPEGDTATRLQSCDSSRYYCDADRKACSLHVCTPGAPVCDLNVAKTCKPDGSGYTGPGTDCSATSQFCTAGACRTRSCEPNMLFCKNGDVYVCSADGLTDNFYLDCRVDQYCLSSSPGCYARICTPGTMACIGTTAARCNADGSGGEPGGTDCSASGNLCSAGQCVPPLCTPNRQFCRDGNVHLCGSDALSSELVQSCTATEQCTVNGSTATCVLRPIIESFEDGDYAGWTAGGINTPSVVSGTAANATSHSLQLTGGDGTLYGGLSRSLPSIRPASISWWVRAGQTNTRAGNFELYSSANTVDLLVRSYTGEDGGLYFFAGSSGIGMPYAADTWYHFELRSIDWGSRTFELYVDGTRRLVQWTFSGTGTSIGRIDLYQSGGVCYFDEIEFR
jgi:hypothetical protein